MAGIILGASVQAFSPQQGMYKVLNNTTATLFKGRAVQLDSDSVIYADSDAITEAEGFLVSDIDPYQEGYMLREGSLKLKDWTLLTGTGLLTQGAKYYLSVNGKMTNVIPTLPGLLQELGTAMDIYTLDIEIQPSIQIT